jgi:hypothetical protein
MLVVMVMTGSAAGQKPSEMDGIVGWYAKHYPFVTMTDSVFTFASEFTLPDGYRSLDSSRMTVFEQWVSNFPLWHEWKSVGAQTDGNLIGYDSISRVVHLPWGGLRNRDFTIPMRILAEWLFYHHRETSLSIFPTKGEPLKYVDFLGGDLLLNRLGEPFFKPGDTKAASPGEYYQFFATCVNYLSYKGLLRNCDSLTKETLRPGDIFVAHDKKGRKGCAFVIMHVIENDAGQSMYAVATSCARSCDFHIPMLTEDRHQPWISRAKIAELGADFEHSGFFRVRQPE